MIHPEGAMANRLHPPGVEAREEIRMRLEMRKQRRFMDDLAAREVHEEHLALVHHRAEMKVDGRRDENSV